jgi:hypothetical protein
MAYASIVFNGTDEVLTRTMSTSSPGTTKFTYSLWVKLTSTGANEQFFQAINAPTNTNYIYAQKGSTGKLILGQDYGTEDWSELTTSNVLTSSGVWYHVVFSFDSTEATADNRIKMHVNGSLAADTDGSTGAPEASEAHHLFANGLQHQIGAHLDISAYLDGKLAFIEVVDGAALDPTSFGTTIGGTWTRKPYTGSYGTYGFCLDGSSGFNDVSGNGQHFTGVNMDASNLDTADLPPYITNPVMVAAAGAFALTGKEAAMSVSVPASAGSFTLSGIDATLVLEEAGYSIAADAGSFALTGIDAGLLSSRRMSTDAGSFSLTGIDASLKMAKTIADDAAAFVMTGISAALTSSRNIAADVGSFALTGIDATVAESRKMAASAGSFAMTGVDAIIYAHLAISPILTALAGAFTLRGNGAVLKYVFAPLRTRPTVSVTSQPVTIRTTSAVTVISTRSTKINVR